MKYRCKQCNKIDTAKDIPAIVKRSKLCLNCLNDNHRAYMNDKSKKYYKIKGSK